MKHLKKAGVCALMGLSFNALAGGTCPATPDAWDAENTTNGASLAITDVGAAGTDCKLSITQGPNNNGIATVRDDMPTDESSYRARFYVDATEMINGATAPQERFKAFVASNFDNFVDPGIDPRARPALMQMFLVADGTNSVRLGGFCRDFDSNGARARFGDGPNPGTVALSTGWNVVEVQVVVGAGDGLCRIWVNNDVEGSPNWEITNIDNAAMEGVKRANIGTTGATQVYATNLGTAEIHFDEFESRRQTFIGSNAP